MRSLRAEPFEIRAHQRLQVSIDRDGRGAFVLAIFGQYLVRDGERHAKPCERARDALFMFGAHEREEERDGDCLDARAFEFCAQLGERRRLYRELSYKFGLAPLPRTEVRAKSCAMECAC